MRISDKFDKPIFLKEDSDAKEYIENLKLLKSKVGGQLVQRLDKKIK